MARYYVFQAKDSVTGLMHYWATLSATGATGYPGPNTPTELTKVTEHGELEGNRFNTSTSGISTASPITWDTPGVVFAPSRLGVYLCLYNITLAVAGAAAQVTCTPRIAGADVPGAARVLNVASGSTVQVVCTHLATVPGQTTAGFKVAWSGGATITAGASIIAIEL